MIPTAGHRRTLNGLRLEARCHRAAPPTPAAPPAARPAPPSTRAMTSNPARQKAGLSRINQVNSRQVSTIEVSAGHVLLCRCGGCGPYTTRMRCCHIHPVHPPPLCSAPLHSSCSHPPPARHDTMMAACCRASTTPQYATQAAPLLLQIPISSNTAYRSLWRAQTLQIIRCFLTSARGPPACMSATLESSEEDATMLSHHGHHKRE